MSTIDAPHFADAQQHLQQLITAALQAADPARCVRRALRRHGDRLQLGDETIPLNRGRVWLVSSGKAAPAMAAAAADVVGERLAGGIVIAKETTDPDALSLPPALDLFLAGHPVANQAGVEATEAVARLLAATREEDLVLCLISGGSSALLTAPRLPLPLWQQITRILLNSGCDIEALNTVRRRLDRVKGGGLARWAAPARCVGLILSDVVGNPLPAIGSGPTVPTRDAPDAARRILEQYGMAERLAPAAWEQVEAVLAAPAAPVAAPAPRNLVIGDVALAARAAADAATGLGFATRLVTTELTGEARDAGRAAAVAARQAPAGRCLIWAGETTVTVRGTGRGGRNQETVLAAVPLLDRAGPPAGGRRILLASVATDGEDRLDGIGGAWATDETAAAARDAGLDPASFLDDNDSYQFFSRLPDHDGRGGLLRMPPSGTNVNDLILALTYDDA